MPAWPELPKQPPALDLSRYTGLYERLDARAEDPTDTGRLDPGDEALFLLTVEGAAEKQPAVFYDFDDGRPRYLRLGARANPRTA